MEPLATLREFISFYEPKNGYNYFYNEFPWLKTDGLKLPIDQLTLQKFYRNDMQEKNLKPIQSVQDNYEQTFTYFLYNRYPSDYSTQKSLNTGISGFIRNIPQGFNKTTTDITQIITAPFKWLSENINTFLIILAVIIVLYVYLKTK